MQHVQTPTTVDERSGGVSGHHDTDTNTDTFAATAAISIRSGATAADAKDGGTDVVDIHIIFFMIINVAVATASATTVVVVVFPLV
jgi:hypothetical protein